MSELKMTRREALEIAMDAIQYEDREDQQAEGDAAVNETDMTLYPRHPLLPPLEPGDTTDTWCSVHMTRTLHIWTGYKLVCLERFPELGRAQTDGE